MIGDNVCVPYDDLRKCARVLKLPELDCVAAAALGVAFALERSNTLIDQVAPAWMYGAEYALMQYGLMCLECLVELMPTAGAYALGFMAGVIDVQLERVGFADSYLVPSWMGVEIYHERHRNWMRAHGYAELGPEQLDIEGLQSLALPAHNSSTNPRIIKL